MPAGQTTTQFLFQTVSCNGGACTGSGNFLDAIEFFKIREEYDTVYVKVNPSPVVNLGNDTTICGSINQVLDAGNVGASNTWNTGATSQTITVTAEGTYSVSVEQFGCIDQDEIIIIQGTPIVLDLGNDTAICEGNSVTFDAENAGSSYLWNTGANAQTIVASTSGEYIVQVSNGDGCTDSDSINLYVSPMPVVDLGNDTSICDGTTLTLDAGNSGSTFNWSTLETSQTINVTESGTYTVTVSGGPSCTDDGSIIVTVLNNPIVDLGNDTSICTGDMITLDAMNNGNSFEWSTTETSQTIEVNNTGAYSVVVTDANECSGSDTINILVNLLPTIGISAPSDVCMSVGNVAVTTSPSGGSLTGAGITGNQFNTNSTQVTPEQPAWLKYSYTDSNECTSIDSTSITVHIEPNPEQIVKDTFVCINEQTTIEISDGGSNHVEWYQENTNNPIGFNNSLIVNGPGRYYVIGFNDWCSTVSDTIIVEEITPFVDGDVNPQTSILEGESAHLFVVNPQQEYTYTWENNSTGESYTTTSVNVSPLKTTSFTLTGQVKTCTATTEVEVLVDPNVLVPNAFSPNGDGSNDEWEVPNLEFYPNVVVHIFNRWGSPVYKSIGTYVPWDGKRSGVLMSTATYYYLIELGDIRGRVLTGSLTIVR